MNKSYIVIIEIVMVILVGIYSVLTWYFFGRDPKRKAVVPEFIEPDYISAMFVAYINGERNSKEILKIGILSLIMKGYISEVDETGTGNKKYVLNKKNRDNLTLRKETLFEEDNYPYFIPFISGTAICVAFTLSKLMQKDIASSMIITIFIFGWLAYVYSMQRGLLKFLYVTITVGGLIGVILYADIFSGIILLILGIMFLVYAKAIGKYTVSGRRKMEYIEGLKMYFETAEKNKIDKFETEEEKLNYFNRIFPYIIALKVEDEKIGIFKESLDFLNIMGSYAEAQYYVNEYVDRKFPVFRKKYIFW